MARGNYNKKREPKEEKEFEQQLVDIARVTRVKAGGKRLSFRALVVIGDKKGRVGAGVGKGADVAIAVDKAVVKAKKNLINVPMIEGTIPHEITEKFKASVVLIKPTKQARGIIAGGPVRVVLELAGLENVISKMKGSHNKINNVWATINGLRKLRKPKISEYKKSDGKEDVLSNNSNKDSNNSNEARKNKDNDKVRNVKGKEK
ncbi:30S ribosomal protein S5 [Patescibacteria group bacterium]|nr:30S ribosomal protein S5 [Patescibacteria group bacterium]MBU4512658.1 30S ribosomal protein S5 [Patescibacteria group bacterium]MCG2693564.1 30S ribosomal protein S5 [Candidatus Parcubacteria bacterium]